MRVNKLTHTRLVTTGLFSSGTRATWTIGLDFSKLSPDDVTERDVR